MGALTASLGLGWGILGVAVVVAWVAGVVDIIRRDNLSSQQRMAWILIVVLLPIVGTIFYFARR
jgi:phosphotransferase system  glucose/maltose/N-acetylglucosamine-specific IIC component